MLKTKKRKIVGRFIGTTGWLDQRGKPMIQGIIQSSRRIYSDEVPIATILFWYKRFFYLGLFKNRLKFI